MKYPTIDRAALETMIRTHFPRVTVRARIPNGVWWTGRTALERYEFCLYAPPQYGRPGTENLWLLRIDSRDSGTGLNYLETPEPLIRWAAQSLARERKLDRALRKARDIEDEELTRQIEVARFLRWPLTA